MSTITKKQLIKNGWVVTDDPVFPATKSLIDKTHEGYDPEIGEWDLVVHGFNGDWQFGMMLPDGARIDLNPSCIEDLNQFEKMMLKYSGSF